VHASARDRGELHSPSPWLYVNSKGPLMGQGSGAALERNRETRVASLVNVPHWVGRLGSGESLVQ